MRTVPRWTRAASSFGKNGYCDLLNKKIGVRPDVEPAQVVRTLVHELGHALLHGEGRPASRE